MVAVVSEPLKELVGGGQNAKYIKGKPLGGLPPCPLHATCGVPYVRTAGAACTCAAPASHPAPPPSTSTAAFTLQP